jgi:prophage regulatory protein
MVIGENDQSKFVQAYRRMISPPVLIPYRDLKAKGVPYSKVHLWRLEKVDKFPRRVPIGPSRYGYVESEIDGYIGGLIDARDAKPVA